MSNITAAEVIESMTPKGKETMKAIGLGQASYFDEGVVAGSGTWGECLMGDMGHSSMGVVNRLRDLGLFTATDQGDDEFGLWWELTDLGAQVAQQLAA